MCIPISNKSFSALQYSFKKTDNEIQTSLLHLATGYKINLAKEGAAQLAIATNMISKFSGYKMAQNNSTQAQDFLSIADGAVSSMQSLSQELRNLALKACNGTCNENERKILQEQANSITEDLYNLKNNTSYNGIKIFGEEEISSDGSISTQIDTNVVIQVGPDGGSNNQIDIDLGFSLNNFSVDISTQQGAQEAVEQIDSLIENLSEQRTKIGTNANQIDSMIEYQQISGLNLASSISTIMDTDYAFEIAKLTQNQILMQTYSALITQANSSQYYALNLLTN